VQVLTTGSILATAVGEAELAGQYLSKASSLKTAFNSVLWDDDAGLYKDNSSTTLHPQDGNTYAALYNLTDSTEKLERLSEALTSNWNEFGAVTPELVDTISPFISSFEVRPYASCTSSTY
jgi:neutral trehalase